MSANLQTKREQEKATIAYMISFYCKKQHASKQLCDECRTLLDYANSRIDSCPFMETKTFCSNCKVHCYQSVMRRNIKEVMRYAGPRMLLHRPIMAMRHVYYQRKERL